ncbi:hypothetical protein OOK60_02205 [Trichothermofontia sichuanensis B231]|uniref:hypothetical protein n=1 Tax=Trichothermofontia sichuanensis TaxID=3045816 RepID=UPI002247E732|nr:hypothetical protein [Trichothermofontia sichuanensis]UZQ54917.1 hypothetical protein OOK60_02205 [Trichothermofontia sichuanensis B231]
MRRSQPALLGLEPGQTPNPWGDRLDESVLVNENYHAIDAATFSVGLWNPPGG